MLTPDEQEELIRLQEDELAERSKDSLADYVAMVLNLSPAAHHRLLIDALEQIEAGMLDLLIVTMPPGSAKSTYGSVAFPAWYLGRNPGKCVIAASHTGELAERFGRKVRNVFSSESHRKVFDVEVSGDSAAAGRWETSAGGEYFAAGVGGSITGRRADVAIIDDPVKSREEADSETIREKQWAWWRDDLSTRLKPGAAVVLIMTRWHEDDLAGRVLKDIEGTSTRAKVIKLPMIAGDGDQLGRMPGEPLWPEWFTADMIERAQREPRTWTALYQQEPRPIGGGELRLEWILYWRNQPPSTNRVILVDPSSGRSKTRGDYTSMWVVGIGPDGNLYVIDGLRDRLNLTERTESLFELVRKHRPAAVGYEQYGLQADVEHIRSEQERKQFRFRIVELGGGMKKEDRIRRLIPLFQLGRIWMPETMPRKMADGSMGDVIAEFKTEYASFPVGAHDDAIDCLARIEEAEIKRLLIAPDHRQPLPKVQPFRPSVQGMGYL